MGDSRLDHRPDYGHSVLNVGDTIMFVLVGTSTHPRCIDALQKLVDKIKGELVVEREIYE
jgi:molybdopterin synthase catalytic subunit